VIAEINRKNFASFFYQTTQSALLVVSYEVHIHEFC